MGLRYAGQHDTPNGLKFLQGDIEETAVSTAFTKASRG